MGLSYKFKPIFEFESKWYRDAQDGAFILYPHPTINDPNNAINGCPYPNVWIRHNPDQNQLEFGIAFWSVPSVDQRFVNFAHNKNEKQKDKALAILKSLPENWLFRVYKKKRFGKDEIVYENQCKKIDSKELISIISKILEWRIQWKDEASEAGNWTTPAINFMRGAANPNESNALIKSLFTVYDEIIEMTPSKIINEETSKTRKELNEKLINLHKNREASKFKDAIDARIKAIQDELEGLVL